MLQALEGLSDREAADALRLRIDWKVACGLALDDEGFHPTTLTYWRNRLRKSDRPRRIFDAVAAVIEATGVLAGRRRRALDSTVVDDAVATQDTVTQLVSAIRRVRVTVPGAGEVTVTAHDYDAAASRHARGTTRPRGTRWSRGWSPTRWPCSPRSKASRWTMRRLMRWGCWRWSPAKMSNPASATGPGASCRAPPRTA